MPRGVYDHSKIRGSIKTPRELRICKNSNCSISFQVLVTDERMYCSPECYRKDMKGRVAWNKDLTKETDERVARYAKNMVGKKSSEESKRKNRDAHLGITKEINPNLANSRKGLTKKDLPSIARQAQKMKGRNKYNTPSIAIMAKNMEGRKQSKESNEKRSKTLKGKYVGENSYQWRGGSSYLPYPPTFNGELKDFIRQRDGFVCQLCGKTEVENGKRLTTHHIDYNKDNCDPRNLTALCTSCNGKVNVNREYWTKFFQLKLKERLYLCEAIQ